MAVINKISDTVIDEQYGEIVGASQSIVVTGVSGATVGDIHVNALDASGVPQPGDQLHATLYPDVRVENRRTVIIGNQLIQSDDYTVQIDIQYRQQRSDGNVPTRGGASLSQIQTEIDKDKHPIEVIHNGDKQRKAATVLNPQMHTTREMVIVTNTPDITVKSFINMVNADEFLGDTEPGTWLCTNVEYTIIDRWASPSRYMFSFEFERNPDGHKYTVVYTDPDGNIPDDIVQGVGIKDIAWHESVAFASIFG